MLFNSYTFLFLFLPVVLTGYYLIGGIFSVRHSRIWLVASSLFFYGWWDYRYLGLLVPSILFNFLIGKVLIQSFGGWTNQRRRMVLLIGVTINLGAIVYFKYFGFLGEILRRIAQIDLNLGTIILPLAISFYTFQQIAFLVDAYSGKTKELDWKNYALFITFFPQLIAGPIVHHSEMMPQFERLSLRAQQWRNLAIGFSVFTVGLFKKAVLADAFSPYATTIFNLAHVGVRPDFFQAWFGALSYTFQLYFDFSGYSDMAIGLGAMFGIILPLNFFSPYKSRNIVDFWRRWHITLSRFLRDYLYIPLGGNRKGKFRRHVNLMITMTLGGLWHGAGWTFVLWGALHGLYLVINHGWLSVKYRLVWLSNLPQYIRSFSAITVTLLAVIIGWVFFRAESLVAATNVLQGMTDLTNVRIPNGIMGALGPISKVLKALGVESSSASGQAFLENGLLLSVGATIALFLPNTWQVFSRALGQIHVLETPPPVNISEGSTIFGQKFEWNQGRCWAFILGAVFVASVLSLTHVSEFLYFQF